MSIIERVAELLGPVESPGLKPSAPGEASRSSEVDLIERVAAEERPRTPSREPSGVGAQLEQRLAREPRSDVKVRSRTPAPVLKIDPDTLRRQSMITLDDDTRTPLAESFRRIKRRILLNVSHPKPGTSANLVMVTSSQPGEGKTFCAVNLALSISLEKDYNVLLVDADVAAPSVSKVLGVKVGKGWMDALVDPGMTNWADVVCQTSVERLTFLPAGTPHPHVTELLGSAAMSMLLIKMSAEDANRVIIFDGPPLLAASEAAVLASQMGQVIVVVEAGRTAEATLKAALGRIETNNVVGLILNKGEELGTISGYGEYGNSA